MTSDIAAELSQSTVILAITIAGPVLLAGLAIGLIIGLLQAATQLHDPSLTFIPKLIVMAVVILFLLPWGLERLTEFATDLIHGIPGTISS